MQGIDDKVRLKMKDTALILFLFVCLLISLAFKFDVCDVKTRVENYNKQIEKETPCLTTSTRKDCTKSTCNG